MHAMGDWISVKENPPPSEPLLLFFEPWSGDVDIGSYDDNEAR